MILTCAQCQTQYKLEPDKLGSGGRMVRCTDCSYTWFQASAEKAPDAQVTETDKEILNTLLSRVHAEKPETGFTANVISSRDTPLSAITHNPLGVSASAFGGLTFCLLVSLTLTVIFLAQKPIMHIWPQSVLLYRTLGVHVLAPGEGLRFSDVVAERKINKETKTLTVDGKMTNVSEHELASPPLQVTLKDEKQNVLKEWKLRSSAASLASGEVVPVTLLLPDAPPNGSSVEIRVREE